MGIIDNCLFFIRKKEQINLDFFELNKTQMKGRDIRITQKTLNYRNYLLSYFWYLFKFSFLYVPILIAAIVFIISINKILDKININFTQFSIVSQLINRERILLSFFFEMIATGGKGVVRCDKNVISEILSEKQHDEVSLIQSGFSNDQDFY